MLKKPFWLGKSFLSIVELGYKFYFDPINDEKSIDQGLRLQSCVPIHIGDKNALATKPLRLQPSSSQIQGERDIVIEVL